MDENEIRKEADAKTNQPEGNAGADNKGKKIGFWQKIVKKKIRFKPGMDSGKDKQAAPKGGLPKKLFKKKSMWIAIGAVIVVVLLVKAGMNIKNVLFGKKKEVEAVDVVTEGIPVKVYQVKRMDFKDTLPVLGTMKGYKEVPLKFQTSGILESFNFEEGEKIQEGDIIANIEQRDALLKLKYAEVELNIAKKMFEAGGIIEDAVEKSRLEYESARSDLEKTNIYAVSDGLLGMQDIDVGTYVTPNDKIGMFVDITRVYATFDIIEKDVPKLKLGQKTEIFIDALPNKNFTGTVDIISPLIEGRTRTERIKVELRNTEGLIKPGMFTRGLIVTYEKKNTIIVPASSLKKKEEGYIVYIVHRDEEEEVEEDVEEEDAAEEDQLEIIDKDTGTVEIRPVIVSYMTQDRVEIEKGIEEGELIVMEIYQELQDKENVEIAEVQEILY